MMAKFTWNNIILINYSVPSTLVVTHSRIQYFNQILKYSYLLDLKKYIYRVKMLLLYYNIIIYGLSFYQFCI